MQGNFPEKAPPRFKISDTWPFDPRKVPFFYGWVVAAVSVLAIIGSIPGQTMGVGVFKERIMESLNLSSTDISWAYMFGTIASSLFLPFGGKIFDRLGARITLTLSAIALALALYLFAACELLANALGRWAGSGPGEGNPFIINFLMVTVCFFAIRFTGQGMLSIASRGALGMWFHRRRGFVQAVTSPIVSLTFSVAPLVLAKLIDTTGWSAAFLILGSGLIVIVGSVAFVFARDRPEDVDMILDGGLAPPGAKENDDSRIVRDYTLREAALTFSFWVHTIALALQGLFVTAYTFHIEELGFELGLGDTILALFVPISIFSVAVNSVLGVVSDKTRLKYILLLFCSAMYVMPLVALYLPALPAKAAFVATMGVTWACFGVLSGQIYPRYFGRQHLGAITGFSMTTLVIASAIGPLIFSIMKDTFGSYTEVFYLFAFAPLTVAALSVFADNPQRLEAERMEA